jgi:hypothetical protein
MKAGKVEVAIDALGRTRQGHSQIAMQYYPYYFDADQLYDLADDPHEQVNLFDEPAYHDTRDQLRSALADQLASFEHPYPLDDQPFRRTPAYQQFTEARRALRPPGWWDGSFRFRP